MGSEGHTGLCISSFEAFLKSCPGLLFPGMDSCYFFTKFLMPLSSVCLESLKLRVPSLFDRSSLRKHYSEHSPWPSFLAPIQSPRLVWPLSHLWDRATDSSQTSVSILLLSDYVWSEDPSGKNQILGLNSLWLTGRKLSSCLRRVPFTGRGPPISPY